MSILEELSPQVLKVSLTLNGTQSTLADDKLLTQKQMSLSIVTVDAILIYNQLQRSLLACFVRCYERGVGSEIFS